MKFSAAYLAKLFFIFTSLHFSSLQLFKLKKKKISHRVSAYRKEAITLSNLEIRLLRKMKRKSDTMLEYEANCVECIPKFDKNRPHDTYTASPICEKLCYLTGKSHTRVSPHPPIYSLRPSASFPHLVRVPRQLVHSSDSRTSRCSRRLYGGHWGPLMFQILHRNLCSFAG